MTVVFAARTDLEFTGGGTPPLQPSAVGAPAQLFYDPIISLLK